MTTERSKAIARRKAQLDTREQELLTRFKRATADLQQQLSSAVAEREQAVTSAELRVPLPVKSRRHLLNEAKAAMSGCTANLRQSLSAGLSSGRLALPPP